MPQCPCPGRDPPSPAEVLGVIYTRCGASKGPEPLGLTVGSWLSLVRSCHLACLQQSCESRHLEVCRSGTDSLTNASV